MPLTGCPSHFAPQEVRDAKFSGLADHEEGTATVEEIDQWRKVADDFISGLLARKNKDAKEKVYTIKDIQRPLFVALHRALAICCILHNLPFPTFDANV